MTVDALDETLADYKPVGAVANAIAILRALAQAAQPVGVAWLARETGVSVSTCFNILRTLTHERLISFDVNTKTYAIGAGILELSLPILGANQAHIIRPELERLTNAHGTLICLWQFVKTDRIVLIDRVAAPEIVRVEMPEGARLPAFAGAIGRCYAALLNLPEKALRAAFTPVKWQSPPSFDEYCHDAERAREEGFALDTGQLFTGLDTVAALVPDRAGKARLGISGIAITGTKDLQGLRALGNDLCDTADWISEILFGVPRGALRGQRKLLQTVAPVRGRRSQ